MKARELPGDPSRGASQAAARLGGDIDDALADIRIPAFILSRDGVIRWQNLVATELVGDSRGRHFSSVVAPESVHYARMEFAKQMIGKAPASALQLVLRSPAGTRSAVDIHTVAIDDSGRVVGSFAVMEVDTAYESPPRRRETLTPRQHQVLVELARGASTEEIAASLGIARETARNHVQGVLRSLGAHSRLAAVAEGRRRGLLGP